VNAPQQRTPDAWHASRHEYLEPLHETVSGHRFRIAGGMFEPEASA
jgi:hypothetical protein